MGKLRIGLGVAAALATFGIALVIAPPAASAVGGAPCSARAKACIQLHTNTSWLMNNGAVTYGGVRITSGRPGFRTPTGVFRVSFKDRHHWSKPYRGPMPYSVFFNGGIAFHAGSLSVPSHGCIHLSNEAAARYFNTLKRGDIVEVVR